MKAKAAWIIFFFFFFDVRNLKIFLFIINIIFTSLAIGKNQVKQNLPLTT